MFAECVYTFREYESGVCTVQVQCSLSSLLTILYMSCLYITVIHGPMNYRQKFSQEGRTSTAAIKSAESAQISVLLCFYIDIKVLADIENVSTAYLVC